MTIVLGARERSVAMWAMAGRGVIGADVGAEGSTIFRSRGSMFVVVTKRATSNHDARLFCSLNFQSCPYFYSNQQPLKTPIHGFAATTP